MPMSVVVSRMGASETGTPTCGLSCQTVRPASAFPCLNAVFIASAVRYTQQVQGLYTQRR